MVKPERPDINPDDYLDTELGYDMSVDTRIEPVIDAKSEPHTMKPVDVCNPDDYIETELGYEYEAGEEACE